MWPSTMKRRPPENPLPISWGTRSVKPLSPGVRCSARSVASCRSSPGSAAALAARLMTAPFAPAGPTAVTTTSLSVRRCSLTCHSPRAGGPPPPRQAGVVGGAGVLVPLPPGGVGVVADGPQRHRQRAWGGRAPPPPRAPHPRVAELAQHAGLEALARSADDRRGE